MASGIPYHDQEQSDVSTVGGMHRGHSYSMSTARLLQSDEYPQANPQYEYDDAAYKPPFAHSEYAYDPAGYSTDTLADKQRSSSYANEAPYAKPENFQGLGM